MSKRVDTHYILRYADQNVGQLPESDSSTFAKVASDAIQIVTKLCASAFLLVAASGIALSQSSVEFTGDFETGQVQPKQATHDGFFVKTLPNPQGSVDEIVVAKGGAGPDSNLDTRVVLSDQVGSELVRPRSGNYFARAAVYFDKDYSNFAGNSGKNKPRTNLNLNSHPFDYDTEGYVGFSIYVPSSFEDETGKKGEQGKSMLLTVGAPSAETFYSLNVWVPSGESKAHWYLRASLNAKSVTENDISTVIENHDLGAVEPDKGKWTDFVIRFRSNPFSTTTNPARIGIANGRDQSFAGNQGILQVWKAEGPSDGLGNRKMVQKLDLLNRPIGLVPHESWQLDQSFRIYKHGWHQQPTSVQGPVWFGFDEIRYGLVDRDGTHYEDVNPSGLPCTDRCPSGSTTSPAPGEPVPNAPAQLTIAD